MDCVRGGYMPVVEQIRKAFTLIELLVVVVIIAVLAGVITAQFSKAKENGWSARCKANLRGLHQATLSYMNEHGGEVPRCDAPYESKTGTVYFGNWPGWVAGSPAVAIPTWPTPGGTTTAQLKPPVWWGDGATWSIANGLLWDYTSRHAGTYLCPKFANICGKNDAKRSYAMNRNADGGGELSRRLLFAEMQPLQTSYEKIPGSSDQWVCLHWASGSDTDGDDGKLDPCHYAPDPLDIPPSPDPATPWRSKKESIGMFHPMGGEYRGHCVFMDGHVEAVGLRQPDGTYSNRTYDACNGSF